LVAACAKSCGLCTAVSVGVFGCVRAGVCPRVCVCAVVRALSCTLHPSKPLREGGHERGVSELLHRACDTLFSGNAPDASLE
jgi:hypothetical protein